MGQMQMADDTSSNDETDMQAQGTDRLEPFIHQVGGHVGLLCWNWDTVCKPHTSRENDFYQKVPAEFKPFMPSFKGVVEVSFEEEASGHLLLVARSKTSTSNSTTHLHSSSASDVAKATTTGSFRPQRSSAQLRFRMKKSGSLELDHAQDRLHTSASTPTLSTDESDREHRFLLENSSKTVAQNPWAIKCQTKHIAKLHNYNQMNATNKHAFILLENLVCRLRLPCVIDLKMGIRQHGDDASVEKKKSQTLKCQKSTSAKLGVRLVGMQVYDRSSGVYKCVNKYRGRELDVVGLKKQMRYFLGARPPYDQLHTIGVFVSKLQALKQIMMSSSGFRFYSSSLLLMYDAAGRAQTSSSDFDSDTDELCGRGRSNTPPAGGVDIRMIDFEHSTFPGFRQDRLHQGVDDGYMLGIDSLLEIFTEIRANLQSCSSMYSIQTPTILETSFTSSAEETEDNENGLDETHENGEDEPTTPQTPPPSPTPADIGGVDRVFEVLETKTKTESTTTTSDHTDDGGTLMQHSGRE